ncbi:(2E,6E)-farnesyl diphosphate synthase [Seminibacterium arietis]|uniref:(2E,6E)-farnesyl diphosphate synthase n=1 Tax=Seminibacterium arietis TaxID=1173502 RepID=A0ABW3I694_9PAST
MYQFNQDLHQLQQRINLFLENRFVAINTDPSPLNEAMKYGVLLGGKRIRPFLVYVTGRMLGASMEQLDYAAAAIESIHAYSLIHDDLPAMDNDNLRRGKPTCHIAFDESTAILAGDALQSFAFELLTEIPELSNQQKISLIKTLAIAAGVKGMCLGQSLDLISEQKQISLLALETIHRNKTGALLCAALKLGFLCSPHFEDQLLAKSLENYCAAIGLAFQIQDDILDIEGDSSVIGKPVGSDLATDKSTYPKLLGLQGAKQKAKKLYLQAIRELESLPFDTTPLQELAAFIINRRS